MGWTKYVDFYYKKIDRITAATSQEDLLRIESYEAEKRKDELGEVGGEGSRTTLGEQNSTGNS